MNKQNFPQFLILGGLIVMIIIGVGGYYLRNSSNKSKACTMDAKICPDGSSVGRVLPNCEFAPCPTNMVTPTNTNVDCGGWDTSGEIVCECSGKIIKPTCPPNSICDGGSYKCEGKCGKCCYKGIAKGAKYPNCTQ